MMLKPTSMTSGARAGRSPRRARGYVLMIVLVAVLVISAIAVSLTAAVGRDRAESRQQANVLKALYAAEGSVVHGVAGLQDLMRTNPRPSVADLHTLTPPSMTDVTFSSFQVDYVDPTNNYQVLATAPTSFTLEPIVNGPFSGLNAQLIPIQVLTSSQVFGAKASLADIMEVQQIPVFQFAIFFDQELEFYLPEPSTVGGRMHSNRGIYFGSGADDITIDGNVTSAGRIHLREIGGSSSSESRSPLILGSRLRCDNAATSPDGCPSGQSWLSWTQANMSSVEDEAHGTPPLKLPTGVDAAAFTQTVLGTPDLCGKTASGSWVTSSGTGVPLSPDWQLIDLPRSGDTAALQFVKYAHRAGIRVIDGVWERLSSGTYSTWFQQGDGSSESNCIYYGYSPTTSGGSTIADSDGVPAIRDIRFWDFQDRRMRRVLQVDIHRLNRCLPELETSFNGVLYFGEDTTATTDNWGLNPDDAFYELSGGSCDSNFLKLPDYLRGQLNAGVSAVNPLPTQMPDYLRNDDLAGTPVLDNPYYPSSGFCAPTATRPKGLGDGPMRLPQGDHDGVLEPQQNELVESGIMLINGERLPTVVDSGVSQGFTVATNVPVYIKGDYNVRTGTFSATGAGYSWGKVPASIAADATTFLSNKYNELQENPFAPVGPLATWQTLFDDGTVDGVANSGESLEDDQRNGSDRRWTRMKLARFSGGSLPLPAAGDPARFDTDLVPAGNAAADAPSSPAPCVNVLRELALRRNLSLAGGSFGSTCSSNNCGLDGLTQRSSTNGLTWPTQNSTQRDWFLDLRTSGTPASLKVNADSTTAIASGNDNLSWMRLMNAFVAFAPLERFLDVSMYGSVDPAASGYSNRTELPTLRNNREVLRDWMRCTLYSDHHMHHDGSGGSNQLSYSSGSNSTGVYGVDRLQRLRTSGGADPQWGMKASGSAAIDVTYLNILGHDGWAPSSTDSVFRSGGQAFFTRDRSSLDDPNGQGSPGQISSASTTSIQNAANGDQLALNVSLLTGTTWRCPNQLPTPDFTGNNPRSNANSSVSTGKKSLWWVNSLDEGLYGLFRYQESWHEVNHNGFPGSNQYIDFFINGSVVAMFHSPEANGRHVINQAFHPHMLQGCSGTQDFHMTTGRNCRLHPGFEYAWESSRRSIVFDPDLEGPNGLPPGVPMVQNYERLRWIRR